MRSTIFLFVSVCLLFSAVNAENKAPDFTLKNLKNERFTLSDHIGKGPILLDFWAFYCKPCLEALPELDRLHHEYSEQGLQVITVSIDNPKSSKKVRPFVGSRKFGFEVLLNPDKEVRKLFGGINIPFTVLINNDGEIVYNQLGSKPGDEETLEKEVKKLLDMKENAEDAGKGYEQRIESGDDAE